MRWLDEGRSLVDICHAYRQQFAHDLPRRRLREFVQQIHELGLVETAATATVGRGGALQPPGDVAIPAPLTDADPASRLNGRFDLLVLLLGWVTHPFCLLPQLALCMLAVISLVHGFDRFLIELATLWHRNPVGLVLLLVFERLVFLTLPRELLVGIACRGFGGRVRALELKFVRRLLPTFRCDVGDSAVLLRGRGRWTLLTTRLGAHLLIGSIAVLGWSIADAGSTPATFWLLLIPPCAVGMVLLANIFVPADGYAVLACALRVPRLRQRALAETVAWLALRPTPEPLTARERFWFRAYGLGVYLWRCFAYVAVIGAFGWLLIRRGGGTGALIGLALLIRWHQDSMGRIMMKNDSVRWLIRGGGRWWVRWPVRLLVLCGVVACGFIPYNHEMSGECRLVPVTEEGVRAEIAGTIDAVRVSEGDWVEQGAVIATLAARDERAAVEMTQAQLARAKADLALLRAGSRPEDIAMAAEELGLRQIQLEYYDAELRRLMDISESGGASEIEIRRAQDARNSAEQMVRIAQENLRRVEKGARDEEIDAAKAEVARLEAQLAHHQELLALSEIRAPITGRVVTPNMAERRGQYVQPGDLIAVLHDTSSLRVRVTLPETAGPLIEPGQLAKLRLWGLEGQLLTGLVQSVSTQAADYTELSVEAIRSDRESQLEEAIDRQEERYIRVYVELGGEQAGLLPGITGYARIVVSRDRLWRALFRPVARFVRVEVWSWLP